MVGTVNFTLYSSSLLFVLFIRKYVTSVLKRNQNNTRKKSDFLVFGGIEA